MKKQTIAVLVFGALQLVQGGAWASTGHETASTSQHGIARMNGIAATRGAARTRAPRLRRVALRHGAAHFAFGPQEHAGAGIHEIVAEAAPGSLDVVADGVLGTRDRHEGAMMRSAGALQGSNVFSGNRVYTMPNAHDTPVAQHDQAFRQASDMADELGKVSQGLAGQAANAKTPEQREHFTQAAIAAGQGQQVYAALKGLHGAMRDAHAFARDASANQNWDGALQATNKVINLSGQLDGAIGKALETVHAMHGHVNAAIRPSNFGG